MIVRVSSPKWDTKCASKSLPADCPHLFLRGPYMPTIAEIFETLEYGPAPESADPALAWLEARGREVLPFIGGEFRRPATGEWFDSLNPATAKPLAHVAQCGAAEVDAAVEAARAAQGPWWELGGHG